MQKLVYIFTLLMIAFTALCQEEQDSLGFVPLYKKGVNYTVKTKAGDTYKGVATEETKDFITLENEITGDKSELRKNQIVRITPTKANRFSKELDDNEENPHLRNYLFLRSAFLFDEGRVTTNAHWFLLENIEYAFNDHWAGGINTLAFYPVGLNVKCAYHLGENNYLGGTVFGVGDVISGGSYSPLWIYGVQGKYTKGNSNRNLTLSAGIAGLSSEVFYSATTRPFVNLSFVSAAFCNRFSKNVAVSLEGWYVPEEAIGLGGLGFKFMANEKTCWTVGCYALLNSYDNTLNFKSSAIPIPYFGVSSRFN